MDPIQLCIFSINDSNEVVKLKQKVNELLTVTMAIKSHCEALKSIGKPVDEEWISELCNSIIEQINAI